MRIVSLNIGRPNIVIRNGRQYSTSINRKPVAGAIELSEQGLSGDLVSDNNVHGGPDKAVCVYSREHYAQVAAWLSEARGDPVELAVPSFGENFTTTGMLETDVALGDVFRAGQALLQITQPRQPCFKLAAKLGDPRAIAWINERRCCGFYFRVLETGLVAEGDSLERVERPAAHYTIDRLMALRLARGPDPAELRVLAQHELLSASWRKWARQKLAGEEEE
ncbi:6-N-hydroxylaminopurine resistance protein [Phycisphaerae bacterium RAS1]|nr:6-N-hydroxylaminopurine resistance protein [Phycisphaerae bacterium RAS1]